MLQVRCLYIWPWLSLCMLLWLQLRCCLQCHSCTHSAAWHRHLTTLQAPLTLPNGRTLSMCVNKHTQTSTLSLTQTHTCALHSSRKQERNKYPSNILLGKWLRFGLVTVVTSFVQQDGGAYLTFNCCVIA